MLIKKVDFNGSHVKNGRGDEVCLRALSWLREACAVDSVDLDDYKIVLSIEKKRDDQRYTRQG